LEFFYTTGYRRGVTKEYDNIEIEIERYIDMLSTLKEGNYHCCPYLFPQSGIIYF
jgi:hypothetical protein